MLVEDGGDVPEDPRALNQTAVLHCRLISRSIDRGILMGVKINVKRFGNVIKSFYLYTNQNKNRDDKRISNNRVQISGYT
jgi:hypothetical protein